MKCYAVITVFFGQVHSEFVQHFSGVSLQSPEQSSTTINDYESKLTVVWQQRRQSLDKDRRLYSISGIMSFVKQWNMFDLDGDVTSVWNLLSQRYREVLMGLNGSKSMLTFFSLPSSVTMVPQ